MAFIFPVRFVTMIIAQICLHYNKEDFPFPAGENGKPGKGVQTKCTGRVVLSKSLCYNGHARLAKKIMPADNKFARGPV